MIPVHQSVMPQEVLEYLVPSREDVLIVDGTLGEGGHSELFLDRYPNAQVVGIDVDPIMGERASQRLAHYGDRFELRTGWADDLLYTWHTRLPDIVLMDLGLSTYHYREQSRGFSFSADGPLDMRLNPDQHTDAAWIVNTFNEVELANLIHDFGEERYSRRIARRIVDCRKKEHITQAVDLAAIVASAMPPSARYGRIHPATRTFQALRIAVNQELDRLSRILECMPEFLSPGGRLGIISFHSLEDRIVKHSFASYDSRRGGNFNVLTRKPLVPKDEECQANPPSRSAKFRVLHRPDIEKIS